MSKEIASQNVPSVMPETAKGLIELARDRDPVSWKARPVSEKQRAYLTQRGVPADFLAQIDRGGAWLLTKILIRKDWASLVARASV